MSIRPQLRTHTSVVIHLRMHFLTSIAKCYLLCLELVVSYFHLASESFYFIHCVVVGSADFSRPEPMMDRRLRLASSSPDVKALFNNSPSYIYHLEEAQESLDSQPSYAPAPVSDYWAPQPPIGRHGRFLSMSHANDDPTLANIPGRMRSDNGLGTDPLTEPKFKDQAGKPRSLTNRAQSLDLTLSLSRIAEGSSRYPPPESPTNSIGDTGPSSSPTSATAPSFPNVYASGRPPIGPGTPQSMRRGSHLLDDNAVDEVSRVISNLGL